MRAFGLKCFKWLGLQKQFENVVIWRTHRTNIGFGSIAQRRREWWKRFKWSYERLLGSHVWCFFLDLYPSNLENRVEFPTLAAYTRFPLAVCMGGDWPLSETNPGCSEWVGRCARTSCPGSWRPLRWCYSRCVVIVSYMYSEMLMPLAHIQTTCHICTDVPLTYL